MEEQHNYNNAATELTIWIKVRLHQIRFDAACTAPHGNAACHVLAHGATSVIRAKIDVNSAKTIQHVVLHAVPHPVQTL